MNYPGLKPGASAEHSLQVEFEKRWREFFAPTEDGWDIVAGIVMEKSDGR